MLPVCLSIAFLITNVFLLLLIRYLSQPPPPQPPREESSTPPQGDQGLDPSEVLSLEFEYARTTASEAMQDRHTMVNFYLIVVAAVASGVTAILTQDPQTDLPKEAATLLLWVLCGVGWLYFLKIVRLREAWHDSAKTMNKIKEFYFKHPKTFPEQELREAFRWQMNTMPKKDQKWNVFFYSAMLIGYLNGVAFVVGGLLIDLKKFSELQSWTIVSLILLGMIFFTFHVWLYINFLRPKA